MRLTLIFTLSLLVAAVGPSYSQKKAKKIVITGKVTDANNSPVAGASIFIDKVKTDQVTDANGIYSIKVKPDASEILVFTLLNGAKEEPIAGRTEINIKLEGNKPGSSGDIPGKAAGKEDQRKTDLRSPGTLDMEKTNVPVFQDIYDMIRGRVSGVEVSGKSIKIRGTNSLNVSTEPLFVVDGIIVNGIDDIAPETVKTIEVLKGPDASVYGTRGSNGVIIITRKKGKD